ncbi:MAG: 30S ribosomal protein S24e [Methanomicrobia archaeon]|nr:30S ribosomal protein S24e [Methanomicrobia archaeon]RLF94248.1 MAG: 30S ribosomal protein S24e [Thermococci archaeon]HEC95675.1 30S ribosomal protein S24e [Euryarchaeota archaeon]RLF95105.1 MAG: 30S ribosomal protein S24e [Thermococci archaeon]RLG01063.1 MAG: 30S ribosomal protein S24e [Thermococci archaeon]
MKIEIQEEKENPLLERKEVYFKFIPETGSEKYEDVRERIAAMLDLDKNTFVIQYMKSQFGKREYRGFLKIYKDEKNMRSIEENYVLKRNGLMGEKQ